MVGDCLQDKTIVLSISYNFQDSHFLDICRAISITFPPLRSCNSRALFTMTKGWQMVFMWRQRKRYLLPWACFVVGIFTSSFSRHPGACRTCSTCNTIIFCHSTNHIIDMWHCRYSRRLPIRELYILRRERLRVRDFLIEQHWVRANKRRFVA